MKRLPVVLSEDEIKKILKVTISSKHDLAFRLGFYDGLRVSEVVKLMPNHLDFGMKMLSVVQGKGQKDRNNPISLDTWKPLSRAVKKDMLPLGVGVRALQRAFKRALKRSGVGKDAHFHTLRHSGATYYYVVKGWPIRMVQQWLGHSRLDTTMIYTHISPDDMMKKMWEETK